MIITVDGGTTNTRLTLIDNGRIYDRVKLRVGVRNSISSGVQGLAETISSGISELLNNNRVTNDDVKLVALSGMIGSENGLADIPHIPTPAGLSELRRAAKKLYLPEITPLPLFFIPGVKTFDANTRSLESMDIMRGEETEIIGILALTAPSLPAVMVLPGSHFKYVDIDAFGRITGFRTTLTGELTRAAAENTILRGTLKDVYPATADTECLRAGYEYAKAHGIGEALFKIRVSANFIGDHTPEQLYSFLMGAMLKDDIDNIAAVDRPVYIGGSNPHRGALYELLYDKVKALTQLSDHDAEFCSAVGAEIICRGL